MKSLKSSLLLTFAISMMFLMFVGYSAAAQITGTGTYTTNLNVSESITLNPSSGLITIPAVVGQQSNVISTVVSYALNGSAHAGGLTMAAWVSSSTVGAALVGSNGGTVPVANVSTVETVGPSHNAGWGGACGVNPGGAYAGPANQYCGNAGIILTSAQLTAAPTGSWTDTYSLSVSALPTIPGLYAGTFVTEYAAF